MKLTIAVSEGLDKLNPKHETILDIRIHDNALLSNMHNQIKKILQLNENDKYYYICEGSKEIAMDTSLSLKELGLGDSEKIYLESGALIVIYYSFITPVPPIVAFLRCVSVLYS
jgi:hypothetical protein